MKKILLTFGAILGAGIACFGSQFAHAESPALRVITHFNGDASDSSANGYFAEPDSGQIVYAQGKLGQAGSFDPNVSGGTNYIYRGYPPIGTADFSMSAWVNISAAAGATGNTVASVAGNGGTPCQNGTAHSGGLGYIFGIADGRMRFRYCYSPDNADDNTNEARVLSGNAVVADGTWHFITLTRTANILSLYADGVLDATVSTPNAIRFDFEPSSQWFNTDGLLIAEIATDSSVEAQDRYNGLLDEFAIFDRALSTQEVNCFYNGGTGKEIDKDESACVSATSTPAPLPPPPPTPLLPPTSPKEPVVIIPGIMGSRINRASDDRETWPNAGKMGSLSQIRSGDPYLNDLKLDANGVQIVAMSTPDIVRAVTSSFPNIPFSGDFYQPLIDLFIKDGYSENTDLFVAPYDWRLDLSAQTNSLAAKIAAAASSSPNGKINVLAHSMGGLLLKKYLSTLANPSFIDKAILVGVPQLGSPETFKTLNYGDNLGIPILNGKKVKEIGQNMQGLYQLLPSRRYIQTSGGYIEDFRSGNAPRILDYDGATALMLSASRDSRNPALLSQADSFHQNLDTQTVNASSVYNIVGCLDPTISRFNIYDNNVVDVQRGSGDGTVPEISAMNLADGYNDYFVLGNVTGIDHQGLVKDRRPLSLIKNIINGTAATSSLPSGISRAAADCLAPRSQSRKETAIEFSTHSPVDLNVYDSQNRHTGPNAAGYVDLDIPGSTYEKMGENSFVTVPAGSAYRTLIQGLAPGTFTLKVKGYAGVNMDREAVYLSIPIQSKDTKAELEFSGFQKNMPLKLDKNGNGRIDATIQPAAVLDMTNGISDVTPPTLALPSIPSQITQGGSLKLTFGANDTGSGIAIINAALNGSKIASGKEVTFTKLGKNIFSLEAIDKAGNPRTGEVDFAVTARSRQNRGKDEKNLVGPNE